MKRNRYVLPLLCLCLWATGCQHTTANSSNSVITSTSNISDKIKVTFDYNYENAPADVIVEVAKGDVVEKPMDPTRNRYQFLGWYNEESCQTAFDFEYALDADTTVYAGWKQTTALVTFDYNYTGSTPVTQDVALGSLITQPSNPERTGYLFTSWYTDALTTTAYDFSTKVTADLTLYAGWEEASGDTVTITYLWNYDGAPNNGVANVATIKTNSKTTAYKAVRGDAYYLNGWYTEAACQTAFDFSKRITSSITLYARWFDIDVFESEYVDYTGMVGYGYSGNMSGTGMITKQKTESQLVSNGYYTGWMYYKDTTLVFNINSAKAVSDAVLTLRLSAEFYNITLTDDTYLVTANGTKVTYSDIAISDVPAQGTNQYKPFEDFVLNAQVPLVQGANVIKLIVNNSNRLGESGTMYATAPLVDALKIYTDATLTWTPLTSNLANL